MTFAASMRGEEVEPVRYTQEEVDRVNFLNEEGKSIIKSIGRAKNIHIKQSLLTDATIIKQEIDSIKWHAAQRPRRRKHLPPIMFGEEICP